MYRPEWNLTHGSLLTQPSNTHEWCSHEFPTATLELLELLSYSHMATDLQYLVAQVAPYLVVATGRFRYLGADLTELVVVKIERDDLRENLCLLEHDIHKFGEHYVVIAGENSAGEDHVTSLDGKVERFSKQV